MDCVASKMFSLVKFDNQKYFVTSSANIKMLEEEVCSVKYRGSWYRGYLVATNDSREKLEEQLNDLPVASTSGCWESKMKPSIDNKSYSLVIGGASCSTPVSGKVPPLGDLSQLSVVLTDTQDVINSMSQSKESSAPSGATDIVAAIGNDWSIDDGQKDDTGCSDGEEAGNENRTVHDGEQEININAIEITVPGKDGNGVMNNQELPTVDDSSIVEETTVEDPSGVTAADEDDVRKDSNYTPSNVVSAGTSANTRDLSSTSSTQESFNFPSVDDAPPVDSREVHVPPSNEGGIRTTKKYFCPYCKKLQTKFARHLETRHKKEADVQKFLHFPKGTLERVRIIEKIRKWGNFMHNTNPDLNTGVLISCRRPQPKFESTTDDYICCSNCKGFFSKRTLRIHYSKCNRKHEKGARGQAIEGRRAMGYIHTRANEMMRRNIFPSFHDDEVSKSIKYDELLILFGNKLCEKYTLAHQNDMIRNHLRLLGRFKCAIKNINKDITDFASIFHPRFYDDVVKAVRVCAKYDQETKMFKTPYNATALGTLLKKCGRLRAAECIKKEDPEGKLAVDNFILLFEDDFPTTINKKVVEDQAKSRREKKIILPSKQDIRQLYNYVKSKCEEAMNVLNEKFSDEEWKKLNESTLILVQMFNRRRAGEIERLLIENYENQETIDKTLNQDIYQKMSDESQERAKQFVRLTIRGKLGRTVPVLLHTFLITYIDTLLKYRRNARVSSTNKYVFAVPHAHSLKKEYLRACPLMRKFASDCGATMPSTLRGTTLRKYIATYTAMLRIEESQVSDLANFMGHDKQIHKEVYRVPSGFRDMTEVSRLLQAAMGDDEEEDDQAGSEEDGSNKEAPTTSGRNIATVTEFGTAEDRSNENTVADHDSGSSKSNSGRKRSYRRIEQLNDDDSSDDNLDTSSSQRQSTSPYGRTRRTKWSDEEKKVVQKHFGDPSKVTQLPSLSQCDALIRKDTVLRGRTAQQLKSWIDNQRKAEGRKRARRHKAKCG